MSSNQTSEISVFQDAVTALEVATGISKRKAKRLIEHLAADSIHPSDYWTCFKEVTPENLQAAGLTETEAQRLYTIISWSKTVWTSTRHTHIVLDQPDLAAAVAQEMIGHSSQESALVICLDILHRIIAKVVLSKGTSSSCDMNPREIFKIALRNRAERIIIAHNHPSGSPGPSADDIATTEIVLKAGSVMGIPVLDHLIVTSQNWVSLRQDKPHLDWQSQLV